jgi:hypothetical protein
MAHESADVAMLCFVLSAVAPQSQPRFIQHVCAALKPSGLLLFRDYADGDLAQKRFRPVSTSLHSCLHVLGCRCTSRKNAAANTQSLAVAPATRCTRSILIMLYLIASQPPSQAAKLSDNAEEYVRHDGTLTYFFTEDELTTLVEAEGCIVEKASYVEKEVVNRAQGVEMGRRWLQLVARKSSS